MSSHRTSTANSSLKRVTTHSGKCLHEFAHLRDLSAVPLPEDSIVDEQRTPVKVCCAFRVSTAEHRRLVRGLAPRQHPVLERGSVKERRRRSYQQLLGGGVGCDCDPQRWLRPAATAGLACCRPPRIGAHRGALTAEDQRCAVSGPRERAAAEPSERDSALTKESRAKSANHL